MISSCQSVGDCFNMGHWTPWKYVNFNSRSLLNRDCSMLSIPSQAKHIYLGKTVCKQSFGKLTTENLIYYKMDLVHNGNVDL